MRNTNADYVHPIDLMGGRIMSQATDYTARNALPAAPASGLIGRPTYQAYLLLHIGYAVLPIVAGLDKFCHLLVNWDQYFAPVVAHLSPVGGPTLMLVVGVIEVAAGLLVAVRPRIGAYVVMLWLWGIIINLLLIPNFYDIALRDFGLSLGALALARLSPTLALKLKLYSRVSISPAN
jgi:uncharacterized membrane protein YphA (DoxX/SURF4 family)